MKNTDPYRNEPVIHFIFYRSDILCIALGCYHSQKLNSSNLANNLPSGSSRDVNTRFVKFNISTICCDKK
jgi:hypothetical protein